MTLIDSLKLIKNQSQSEFFKHVIDVLINDVSSGIFLSKSLDKFKKIFGELFISVIKIAETSGTLPENLLYLSEELRKRKELIAKVRGALIYPIIIFIVTIVIAVAMMVFVFPKLLPLFQSLNVELPLTTSLLIALAGFLTKSGFLVLIGLIVFVIAFRLTLKSKAVRFIMHRLLVYLPIFGKIVIYVNIVNISRTLNLLLRSGVKIVEAINITADTLTNSVYQQELKLTGEMVRKGEFLSNHFFKKHKYFPAIFTNMVAVGENTGNLNENLKYLSEYYESEVDDFVKNLSSTVEPVLLIFMGVIVGFIALSFITPLYKITQGIR